MGFEPISWKPITVWHRQHSQPTQHPRKKLSQKFIKTSDGQVERSLEVKTQI
jgi:hypothetical protein